MEVSDLEFAVRCTATEGWVSETIEDFENFLAFDPNGCFVAEVDKKPAGICIASNYGVSGFIGELVVLRDFRNNKIGTALLEHAINYLKDSGVKSIYLDGVISAVPIYEKIGFKKICKSLRFTGRIEGKPNVKVQSINDLDLMEIYKIDTSLFGAERTYFLERKHKNFPHLCKVLRSDGEIKGYIFGKSSGGLISIGPWVSIDPNLNPLSLLQVIAYEQGKANFRIGVLENNRKAVSLIRSMDKLTEGQFSWRMVLGSENGLGLNAAFYGIGSAAKG